jgi:putative flavoprotein involved in K+ transport
MAHETIDTLVIGGGQAGLSMSHHLREQGIPHLVVEKSRIAESWRTARWDSLVANGPAWHDRVPGLTFEGVPDEDFATKDRVAAYFETYAAQINAPIRCGITVTNLAQTADGFRADTTAGVVLARNVVLATGPFQKPRIPDLVPDDLGIRQIHSHGYRNPDQLPAGAVLVVGAGSSGAQIADELLRAGRKVYLSVGPHDRPPRRYRGRDFVWWLGVLGKWDVKTRPPGTEHITIAVSGAYGGHTIDFRQFAARGMVLLGRANACKDGVLHVNDDLARNIRAGDANYLSVLDEADAYVMAKALDLPPEPAARDMLPDPACMTDPIHSLDLAQAGVTSIIWATGYALDFGWVQIDAFDDKGKPRHQDGVSDVPGLYFIGLPWMSNRASAFIWGAWRDAERLAAHIAQRAVAPQSGPSDTTALA